MPGSSASASTDQTNAGPEGTSTRPWEEELRRRVAFAEGLGGEENITRQHQRGRLTARERVEGLLDSASFREIGRLTGKGSYDDDHHLVSVLPANVVTGTGEIDARPVAVAAEDFTVRGGSSEATSPEKWQYVERLALEYGFPMVRLVESAGGSVNLLKQAGGTKIPGYPHWPFADMLGTVPVVGLALGAAAGLGAIRVVASHFSVMVAGTSSVFAGGPAVARRGVGEDASAEELGGASVHARGSGVVDNEATDEKDAFDQVRAFLSYLPSSVFELPPFVASSDSTERCDPWLADAVPENKRRSYNMRRIISSIFDHDSVFEIGRFQGRSQITALARLDGHPVALLANDPMHLGGALTADSAEKIIRFVDLADTFHLPVVNLVDQPGTYVGTEAERRGTIRRGVRAQMALEQARVPWASVFVRRAYGLAGASYAPLGRPTNWRVAWPSARWGSIPIEGGVDTAYRKELREAERPEAMRDDLVHQFEYLENPFLTAEKFGINDIIDPRTTRPQLCTWVRQAYRMLPRQLGTKARMMRA